MEKANVSLRGNLKERHHSILIGAENCDWDEIRNALTEDPTCINDQDERMGVTPLHIAAGDGNMTLVKFLLEQPGCRTSMADHSGRMPSYMAEAIGRDDIASVLRQASAHRIRAAWADELRALGDETSQTKRESGSPAADSSAVLPFPGASRRSFDP